MQHLPIKYTIKQYIILSRISVLTILLTDNKVKLQFIDYYLKVTVVKLSLKLGDKSSNNKCKIHFLFAEVVAVLILFIINN